MHDIKVQLHRPPGDPPQCSAETERYNNNNTTTTTTATTTATTTTLLKLTRLRNNEHHKQGEQQRTHSEHRSAARKGVVNQVLKVKVQGF